jgi:Aromatic-ring-opening dioxygenase LigAB, LigA subunit
LTIYALQKLIREVNRNPQTRQAFFDAPAQVACGYELSDAERAALVNRDYGALYRFGVHGLLLRPFSILHSISEPDYLRAIRGEG